MLLDLCFLDYVWRGLSVSAVALTGLMFVVAVVPRVVRGGSARVAKWFFNLHYLGMAGVFVSGFFYVAIFDRDLAVGCFSDFVASTGSFTLTRVVAETWVVGAALLLGFDLLRILLASLFGRGHTACTDPKILPLVSELALKLQLRRGVRLFLTSSSVSPHVYGLVRPKIILPKDLLVERELLPGILAHELVHVRERDALWMYFELVVRRLMFFHPLVYWLARDYRGVIERAADEQAVLMGGVEARSLVRSLIFVAGRYLTQPSSLVPAVSRGFHEIKGRVEALGQLTSFRLSRNWLYVVASVLSISGVLVEARGPVSKVSAEVQTQAPMCRQVADERLLRSFLNMQDQTNKCEK